MERRIEESEETISLAIDRALYDTETALKTAHKFTDRCHIELRTEDSELIVAFKSREGNSTALRSVVDDFLNGLVDQQVRAIVSKECGAIREQIVRKAFAPIEQKQSIK